MRESRHNAISNRSSAAFRLTISEAGLRVTEAWVLADGADSLSNLVNAATEKKTQRVLDWFHISMRLRPIEQMSPGIASIVVDADPILTELLCEKIHRVRFQMWNGH
jgi:hypothetical protein